jgi:hypothetical protein
MLICAGKRSLSRLRKDRRKPPAEAHPTSHSGR